MVSEVKPMTVGRLIERLKLFDDNLPVAYGSGKVFTGAKGACTYVTEKVALNGYFLRYDEKPDYIELLVIV